MKLQQLTQDQANHIVPGERSLQDSLMGVLGAGGESEAVSAAGAISVSTPVTYLTVSGTVAYTLADGSFSGQEKRIVCVAASNTPLGTVTIASPETTTGIAVSATHIFTAVGQELHLVWSGTKWRVMRTNRAGTQVLVLGSTATAGMTLAKLYDCQVDGTKNSTGANALPNGQFPGDRCFVGCSSAQNTPIGSIDFAGLTTGSAAVTHLQAIDATTDTVTLEWTGTAWLVVANSGITVA